METPVTPQTPLNNYSPVPQIFVNKCTQTDEIGPCANECSQGDETGPCESPQTAANECSQGDETGPCESPQTAANECSQGDETGPCESPQTAANECSQGDETGPCESPKTAANECSQGDETGPCESPQTAANECSQGDETGPCESPQTAAKECSQGGESESTLPVSPQTPLGDCSQGDEEQEPQISGRENAFKSEEHQRIQQKVEELHLEISAALEECRNQRNKFDSNMHSYWDSISASYKKVLKGLRIHKEQLTCLIELSFLDHHESAHDLYQKLLQGIHTAESEATKYKASLMDLQKWASDHLVKMERGTEVDTPQLGLIARELQHVREMFRDLCSKKPDIQVPRQLLTGNFPELTFDNLYNIVGYVELSEDTDLPTDEQNPEDENDEPGSDCEEDDATSELCEKCPQTADKAVMTNPTESEIPRTTVSEHLRIQQKVGEFHQEISAALEVCVNQRKKFDSNVQPYWNSINESFQKVLKGLREHKERLTWLVELSFCHHYDIVNDLHRQLLEGILVSRTEGKNQEAILMDLQKRANDHLVKMERGTEADTRQLGLIARELQHTKEMFWDVCSKKPDIQVPRQLLTGNFPYLTTDALHDLVGYVELSEDTDLPTDEQKPEDENDETDFEEDGATLEASESGQLHCEEGCPEEEQRERGPVREEGKASMCPLTADKAVMTDPNEVHTAEEAHDSTDQCVTPLALCYLLWTILVQIWVFCTGGSFR
ncbi:uncharacterized protein LOC143282376 [Babylonia areolata]|uniref:uncharacterized protein LOC143282376 n=1 Tax=Babylonia areolata TaxID=304850 RepID=UPI003FCFB34B